MVDLDVEFIPQLDKKLGRQKVHDPRSFDYPYELPIAPNSWGTHKVNIYDPYRNPRQCHGECTGCANAMMLNSENNRQPGEILDMNYAHRVYSQATRLDPWPGSWTPNDTGSSGLAAAKAAQRMGYGGRYRHLFRGADQVVQTIMAGRVVSVGSWWTSGMSRPNAQRVIEPTGRRIGGHQYVAWAYDKPRDLVLIRCWWGGYRDVWIKRTHLNDLLMDGGDAHVQDRIIR